MSISPLRGGAPLSDEPDLSTPSAAAGPAQAQGAEAPVIRGTSPVLRNLPGRMAPELFAPLDRAADAGQSPASKAAERAAVDRAIALLRTNVFDWAVTDGDTRKILGRLDALEPAAWLGALLSLAARPDDSGIGGQSWLFKLATKGIESEAEKAQFIAQCKRNMGALLGEPLTDAQAEGIARAFGVSRGKDSLAWNVVVGVSDILQVFHRVVHGKIF